MNKRDLNQTNSSASTNTGRRRVENMTRKLSDYQLVRIIGTGTFGKVYLSILNGKAFALKLLNKSKIIELQ